MDHAQWLEGRRKGIGGSEAASALGLSRYKSPFQLYLEKIGEITGEEEKAVMARGTRFEPILREIYTERTGRKVNQFYESIKSDVFPFMFVTPDGLADENRYLEIKTARKRYDWGEPGTDEIPQEYLIQVQHGLFVTNLQVADVFVAFSLDDIELYEVQADKELQEMIIDGEREFWSHVETKIPPELTNYEDVVTRYKKSSSKSIAATPDLRNKIMLLNTIKEQIKAGEISGKQLKQEIMTFMGEYDTILDSEGKPLVTWKSSKSSTKFNEEQFKHDHPSLYSQYLKDTDGSRLFLLKKQKEE